MFLEVNFGLDYTLYPKDGRFPLFAFCMMIPNPGSRSTIETGVNP
jgi:hypothetical protein